MSRRRPWRWRAVAAVAVAVAGTVLVAATTGCSTSEPAARQGTPAPAGTAVQVAFGLERDDDALARFVAEVSDPASPEAGRYLGPEELRRRFGASERTVARAREDLAAAGIDDAALDPTGSVLTATVSAQQAADALGVELVVQERRDGGEVVVPDRDPAVPDDLDAAITEVVGLTATVRPAPGAPAIPPSPTLDPGCDDPALADDAAVADTLRWTGTGPLYDAGHDGAGTTIAIWAVEAYDPVPIDAFETCRESPTVQPEVVEVEGTPAAATGDEVTLDVIMAGWTAPGAELVVVQFDPFTSPVLPLVRTLEVDAERAGGVDVVSTSISFCEAALPDAELAVAEHLLLAAAAMGTTTLASAGDHGVAGCWPGDDAPGAAYPASSPWVTAVGGTSLVLGGAGSADDGQIVGEAAWRDDASETAGGGGRSDRLEVPEGHASTGGEGGDRRYPDVSALAAVDRLNAIPRCNGTTCTWLPLGGTSATAPTLAGELAVALSAATAEGGAGRAGWLNPRLADWASDEVILDVTDGSTALLGNDCCQAAAGYDTATGWGSIVAFDELAATYGDLPQTR